MAFSCRARLALAAFTVLVADAGLQGIDFFVDVVEPLPGQLVQHGAPVKLVADVTASRAFAPELVQLCILVDHRQHSCIALSHPGRPRIRNLPVGRHSIDVELRSKDRGEVLFRALSVTLFVERYERVELARLGSLHELAVACGTDKSVAEHYYTRYYARYLEPLREAPRALRILEIGVRGGSSLQLWHAYFPRATIIGIDISLKNTNLAGLSERVTVMECDQSDPVALQRVIDRVGGEFDVIIDDGGHTMQQQQVSLGFLLPHLAPGGLYIVEDLHTSKSSFYERQLYNPTGAPTTLALLNSLIDADTLPAGSYLTPAQARYAENHTEFVDILFRRAARGERAPRRQAGSLMAILGKRPH